ncbi:hypothetical protein QGN29_02355 [Temperatibacter marinus]|uniref:Glycosyl hydrolase family 32 N-terminal domain-containing protein n=1 Tax=Temperatibacter marinus TaxID=1456591 RepID=A0AA52EJ33_9PROT|nr:hypothetical protein [Temperatibacter marinus]WND03209.1 hypothetical protein QGN29_02355 [Temperatibacter marinus]
MKWEKLGHVFVPDGSLEWMKTHAANPVVRPMGDDIVRVYFSGRSEQNQAHISWLEIDMNDPLTVQRLCDKPVLSPGDVGLFDDSGVSMGCFAEINGKTHLFYLGWNLGVTVPWRNSIGAAVEQDDGSFVRVSKAPILDRCHADPYSISYPWILQDDKEFHIWYGSNLAWGDAQEDMAHLMKYARSDDGLNWNREGHVALPFKDEGEYAMSKPCVIKDPDGFKMWYSYRGLAYRIGYAESKDGKTWVRKDEEVGISVSEEGWDSETVEYPCVFDHKGSRYMLYNGNAYGLTGFGMAKLK